MTSTAILEGSDSGIVGFSSIMKKLSSSKTEFFAHTLKNMAGSDIKTHEDKIMNDIKSMIIGYNTKIITPIGKMCSLYADHTATGRPFMLFERHILEDIKPRIANSHTETSEMGRFSTHLMHYSEESILNSFSVSKKTHFAVPAGFGCTGALERLVRILNIERQVMQTLYEDCSSKKKEENDKLPVVFITPYEHHSNILPWVQTGCNVKVIDSDSFGNLDIKQFKECLSKHINSKTIVVTTSAASNVTSQHTNLAELNVVIKEFRKKIDPKATHLHWNIDGAAYCPHARLDLKVELSDCDSVILSPHKNLGGTEATGVLVMRTVAYNKNMAPSFPGGGTVAAVIGIKESDIFYDTDPAAREMPGSPNVIGFYRAALTFQLQDWIGLDLIQKRETENAAYFYNKLMEFNQKMEQEHPDRRVEFIGEGDLNKRYGVFSFNILGPGTMELPSGQRLFHPHFVAKILNDFFGIQVRSGCSCAGPFGVKMLGISYEQASDIAQKVADGQEAIKPGWVRLDTNFVFSKFELEYIVKAIELVALHAEKLLGFYVQESNGQWNINNVVNNPSYSFGMTGVLQSPLEPSEFDLEERKGLFQTQLAQALIILEDPHKFLYKLKQNGLLDVSDRVKNMFKRGTIPGAQKENHYLGNSSESRLQPVSPKLLEGLEEENFENLGLKGKLRPLNNYRQNNYKSVSNGNIQKILSNKQPAYSMTPLTSRLRMVCSTCRKPIEDKNPMKSGGKVYHQECFKCFNCNVTLNSHYLQDEEKVCCQECYHYVKCTGCGLNLNNEHIQVMSKGYHIQCYAIISAKRKELLLKQSTKVQSDGKWK